MAGLKITEAELQAMVIESAILYGWRVAHFRAARTAKGWRTPVQGLPGLPDLVLARNGVVLLAELKSEKGRVDNSQKLWLRDLGTHARLWRPADWFDGTIVNELKRGLDWEAA